MIDGKFEYFAFISYKEEDAEWAKWLQHELENYKLPTDIRQNMPELPEQISPVYEYKSEASGGRLKEVIWRGLISSKFLIVICSPRATKSEWINNGIRYFVDSGREEYIIPFIVEGKPKAPNLEEECFPDALMELKGDRELRGIHIDEMGQDAAAVKVVSTMLDIKFDNLWNRALKEKEVEMRRLKEQNDRLLIVQSRLFAARAIDLVDEGDSYTARLLALEALPKDLENPDRPYILEAEKALRASASKETAILKGHVDHVYFVAFRPGEKYIASSSSSWKESVVRFWDAISLETKESFRYVGRVCILPNGGLCSFNSEGKTFRDLLVKEQKKSIAITFDGRLLAIPVACNTVCVWNTTLDILLYSLSEAVCFAFNYKGDMLITCGWHDITLWNMKDGSVIQTLKTSVHPNYSNFSPDGQSVLIASSDNAIYMYSVPDLDLIRKFEGHTNECKCANFSSDGNLIVSTSEDNTIRIWKTEPNMPSFMINLPTYWIHKNALAYCPDGEHIISAGIDKTLCMWNVKNGNVNHSYKGLESSRYSWLSFSPDGKCLLSGDGEKVIMWDLETEQIVHQYDSENSRIVHFSPNGKKILMVGYHDFSILDVATWTIDRTIYRPYEINAASISHDGQRFAVSFQDDLEIWKEYEYDDIHPYDDPEEYSLDYFWQLSNGKCISKIATSDVDCLREYKRGKPISQLEEGNMKRWLEHKTVLQRETITIKGSHGRRINTIAFSPDNNYVATGSVDSTIKLWDILEMKEVKTFVGHTDEVISVEFSKNGNLLLSASKDRTVRIWDVENGVELYRLLVEEEEYNDLFKACFSPDNKWIATLSDTPYRIKIWPFPSLQDLINETRERFKNRQLTPEERKKYYLD